MSELEKYKEKIFLGLKRKPVQIFTNEELQAMEQKTNDEYENSDNEMIVEDDDFFRKIINQSLFIHIGNGQYILDYERIQKNPNLILPKSFGNLNNDAMMLLIIGVALSLRTISKKQIRIIMKIIN